MDKAGRATGTPPDAHDGWIVVETLAEPIDGGALGTVVAKDGRAKEWTALQRSVPNKRVADAARAVVASVVETGVETSVSVPGMRVPLRAVPVAGPSRAVHGVLLYVGDDADASPPDVTGWDWTSADRLFEYTTEMDRMVPRESGRGPSATAFEFFDRNEDAESAMYLMVALFDADPGTRWDGAITLRTSRGPRPLRIALRTVHDEASRDDRITHGLSIALRDDEFVSPGPSFEAFALRSLTRDSPTAIALIDAERVRLTRWLTEPVPDILWKGQVDQRDTPHPEDIARIVSAYRHMHEWVDRKVEIPGVRLRRVDGGWTVVDLRATRIPHERFLMVEFQPVGFSSEPDPVPVTDTGYPGRGPRPSDRKR
ncbi:hypothetical protein RU01_08455 [Rhodococcus sp. MEB064]|nr:hypothetical protein RU01_08455 [Rhodococcus sp. MEB064]